MTRQIMTGYSPPTRAELEERISELETKVVVLAEAVTVLAQGLKTTPGADPGPEGVAHNARLAHELLMEGHLAPRRTKNEP